MDLILASTSVYRQELVARLGQPFRCVAPGIDEEVVKRTLGEIEPRELAERLAMAKAESLARVEPGATVIGGDQLVACDGRILGKPGTVERAVAQLQELSGRTHELITALVVIHEGKVDAHTDVAMMTLRPLTPDQTFRYVVADRPLDCAGSYKLEARGITLFERIESADHSAIVGIPLIALTTILGKIGYPTP
jgi:septum formation protein